MKLKVFTIFLFSFVSILGCFMLVLKLDNPNTERHKTPDTIRGYFKTNNNGDTYGTFIEYANGSSEEPDLIEVVGENNINGYVKKSDLYDTINQPNNPEEAIAYMKKREQNGPRKIPIYEKDGKTKIGEYKMD